MWKLCTTQQVAWYYNYIYKRVLMWFFMFAWIVIIYFPVYAFQHKFFANESTQYNLLLLPSCSCWPAVAMVTSRTAVLPIEPWAIPPEWVNEWWVSCIVTSCTIDGGTEQRYEWICDTELLAPPPECKNSPLMVTKIYSRVNMFAKLLLTEFLCVATT